MKKVSLLAILATAASIPAAMAQTPVASSANCPKAFQGFGLKGILGYATGTGQQKTFIRHIDAVDGDILNNFSKRRLGFNGIEGGVGVDYNYRICNWAIGLAFDAKWGNASSSANNRLRIVDGTDTHNFHSHAKVQFKNSLDLYARAGYVLANMVMPFVGLGWDNAQWSQRATIDDTAVAGNRGSGRSHSKRVNGLMWKAGVDFLATRHVVLGFEYTGVSSGKVKSHFNGRDRAGDPLRTASSFKPQYNSFALTAKLVY